MLPPQEVKEIFAKASAIITGEHFVYARKETGWFHGPDYVNKDAIYLYSWAVRELCSEIAGHFLAKDIEVVVGPTVGGVVLSQWTAYSFICLRESFRKKPGLVSVLSVCADEEDVFEQVQTSVPVLKDLTRDFSVDGKLSMVFEADHLGFSGVSARVTFSAKNGTRRVIRRGYEKHVKGRKCLIVEDVINTGITVVKTRDAVLAAGGKVIGVGAFCNRSGGRVTAETLRVPELFSLLDLDMIMFPEEECPICKELGPESVRTDIGKGTEFLARIAESSRKPVKEEAEPEQALIN